jgi:hypothetical protein
MSQRSWVQVPVGAFIPFCFVSSVVEHPAVNREVVGSKPIQSDKSTFKKGRAKFSFEKGR